MGGQLLIVDCRPHSLASINHDFPDSLAGRPICLPVATKRILEDLHAA